MDSGLVGLGLPPLLDERMAEDGQSDPTSCEPGMERDELVRHGAGSGRR